MTTPCNTTESVASQIIDLIWTRLKVSSLSMSCCIHNKLFFRDVAINVLTLDCRALWATTVPDEMLSYHCLSNSVQGRQSTGPKSWTPSSSNIYLYVTLFHMQPNIMLYHTEQHELAKAAHVLVQCIFTFPIQAIIPWPMLPHLVSLRTYCSPATSVHDSYTTLLRVSKKSLASEVFLRKILT